MSTETDKKEARSYRAWQLTVLPVLAVCTLGLFASMYGCATAVAVEWPEEETAPLARSRTRPPDGPSSPGSLGRVGRRSPRRERYRGPNLHAHCL